jgi:hypothetical protein
VSKKTWAVTVWNDKNHKELVTCRSSGDVWHALIGLFTGSVVRVEIEQPKPMWTVRIWMDGTDCHEVHSWPTIHEANADCGAAFSRGARKVEIEQS